MVPPRPVLSSKPMILFLDNAESTLDPQGTEEQEIYAAVGKLGCFSNIYLGTTSRISAIPPHCKRQIISTLFMEPICDIFYDIFHHGGRSDIVNDILRCLDFRPLPIKLLATAASCNMWSCQRLAEE